MADIMNSTPQRIDVVFVVLPYGAPEQGYVEHVLQNARSQHSSQTMIIVPSCVPVPGCGQTESEMMVAALKEGGWGQESWQHIVCLNKGTSGKTNLEEAKRWMDGANSFLQSACLCFIYDRSRHDGLYALIDRIFLGHSFSIYWYDFDHAAIMRFYLLFANILMWISSKNWFGWVDTVKSRLIREGRAVRALATGKAR